MLSWGKQRKCLIDVMLTPPLIQGLLPPAGAGMLLPPAGEMGAVCRLIAALGHANFMDELAREYAALTGAAQVTTFVVEQQRVRCTLA